MTEHMFGSVMAPNTMHGIEDVSHPVDTFGGGASLLPHWVAEDEG